MQDSGLQTKLGHAEAGRPPDTSVDAAGWQSAGDGGVAVVCMCILFETPRLGRVIKGGGIVQTEKTGMPWSEFRGPFGVGKLGRREAAGSGTRQAGRRRMRKPGEERAEDEPWPTWSRRCSRVE